MKSTLAAVATLTMCTVFLAAQAPQPPKPGPEHQRLNAFVGNWTFQGEIKPGPMGPGGKLTGTDRIQWMPGGFFVERRFEGKSPAGEMRGLEIMGYDAAKKAYTYNYFDSMGMMGTGTFTISGSTWNATGTGNMGGQILQERCALTFGAGNATLNVKCEISTDGKTWNPMVEGTATKAK